MDDAEPALTFDAAAPGKDLVDRRVRVALLLIRGQRTRTTMINACAAVVVAFGLLLLFPDPVVALGFLGVAGVFVLVVVSQVAAAHGGLERQVRRSIGRNPFADEGYRVVLTPAGVRNCTATSERWSSWAHLAEVRDFEGGLVLLLDAGQSAIDIPPWAFAGDGDRERARAQIEQWTTTARTAPTTAP